MSRWSPENRLWSCHIRSSRARSYACYRSCAWVIPTHICMTVKCQTFVRHEWIWRPHILSVVDVISVAPCFVHHSWYWVIFIKYKVQLPNYSLRNSHFTGITELIIKLIILFDGFCVEFVIWICFAIFVDNSYYYDDYYYFCCVVVRTYEIVYCAMRCICECVHMRVCVCLCIVHQGVAQITIIHWIFGYESLNGW